MGVTMAVDKEIQGVLHTVVQDIILEQTKDNIQDTMFRTTETPTPEVKKQGAPVQKVRTRLHIVK
jgi:hypothetical protein